MYEGMEVTIEAGEGQSLRACIGKRGTIVGFVGPFVVIKVDEIGLRASLPEYVQPFMTAEIMAQRLQNA